MFRIAAEISSLYRDAPNFTPRCALLSRIHRALKGYRCSSIPLADRLPGTACLKIYIKLNEFIESVIFLRIISI
jgi:hypothetical protein